jgi:thiol-disulfide isomerase/thioredoxin
MDVKEMNGNTISTSEFINNGKITIVSFWASWCKPCKLELDAIAEIYPDWVEDYDVELVAITIDNARGLSKVPSIVSSKGWEYRILSDSNQDLQRALNFQSIPQTFLLDQAGNIVFEHNGYQSGNEFELEDEIKAIAGK